MTSPSRLAHSPRCARARKAQQVWVGVCISCGAFAQVVVNLLT